MSKTSRLSRKGQVTIPSQVRKVLHLSPGDLVAYEVRGEKVVAHGHAHAGGPTMGGKDKGTPASDVARGYAASIFVVPARTSAPKRGHIACLWTIMGQNGCSATFDAHPISIGQAEHRSCPDGLAYADALAAARKAGMGDVAEAAALDLIDEVRTLVDLPLIDRAKRSR